MWQALLPTVSAWAPLSGLHALSGRSTLFPYYHLVSDEAVPHVRHLYPYRGVAEFVEQVDFFLRHYQILSLTDLAAGVRDRRPAPKRAFLLSFDDGFREMHDIVMPILVAKGVPAVFFLNSATLDNRQLAHHQKISLILERQLTLGARFPEKTALRLLESAGFGGPDLAAALNSVTWSGRDVIDRVAAGCELDFSEYLRLRQPYLSSAQVEAMLAAGMDVGAHSVDHPRYAQVHLAEQIRQTRDSMETLVRRFGLRHRAFAFPHSDAGVASVFFQTVFGDRIVEVTFGTAGLVGDAWPGHFQRFSMEKGTGTPRQLLSRHCARAGYRRLRGQGAVQHH